MAWGQIFLDIEFDSRRRVVGESEFGGFQGQIVLLDFGWKLAKSQDVKKDASGKVNRTVTAEPMSFSKRFDQSSLALMDALKCRDHVKHATITVAHRLPGEGTASRAATQELRKAYVLRFSDASLESVGTDMKADGNSMVLQEDWSLRYKMVRFERYARKEDGSYSNVASTYEGRFAMDLGLN